ncbi:tRNA (adenosine(37)-N6)-threonylcarbamoyltransferase complex ATPase subunit type 1 TsaE [Chlamydiota bacterium]
MKQIVKHSNSATETNRLGKWFSQYVFEGGTVALCGEFGSGKTVFVKGVASGLGVRDVIHEVISPSFILVREYSGTLPIYHFDLYRLNSIQDLLDIGYDDYYSKKGLVIIEWAEKFFDVLPDNYIRIDFFILSKNKRRIVFYCPSSLTLF